MLTLLLMVARAPAYFDQLRGLNTSTDTISVSYSRVIDILGKPKVRAAIERCKPINAFTHETVPIIRYELRAGKDDVPATTQLASPPRRGIQLLQTSALDPLQMTVVTRTTRKPWTGFHQPGFVFLGENRAWIAYSSCVVPK